MECGTRSLSLSINTQHNAKSYPNVIVRGMFSWEMTAEARAQDRPARCRSSRVAFSLNIFSSRDGEGAPFRRERNKQKQEELMYS